MGWLHTWAGILVSSLAFAIFWMGTLTVFHEEIDQWMKPELRVSGELPESLEIDSIVLPLLSRSLETGGSATIDRPTATRPIIDVYLYQPDGAYEEFAIVPATGEIVTSTNSLAASNFFYPFHYMLHIGWASLGYWIVAFISITMLVLLVSGLFVHRKIFTELFVFRPERNVRRSSLDAHNLSSLIGLPFYILMPLSGLYIFFNIFLPWSTAFPYFGDGDAMWSDLYGAAELEPVGIAAELGSIDSLVVRVEALWSERSGVPAFAERMSISNFGDENVLVTFQHAFQKNAVAMYTDLTAYRGSDGILISDWTASSINRANLWSQGAHFLNFDHMPIKWLFFSGGLMGCIMIATGLIFWIRSRIPRTGLSPTKVQLMRTMTIGSTTGIMAASVGFLVANRLLTNEAQLFGIGRAAMEVWFFLIVWIFAFLHAHWRREGAWRDQCISIALLCVAAACLNWITTFDHPFASLASSRWAVFGVDAGLLSAAIVAMFVAFKLGTPKHVAGTPSSRQTEHTPTKVNQT